MSEWSASHPGCFTRVEKFLDVHWLRRCKGGADSFSTRWRRGKFLTLPGIEPRSSSR